MKYTLRSAVQFLASNAGIELTDDELTRLLDESGEAIEAKGRAVREASQAYEQFVVDLATAIRKPGPGLWDVIPQRDPASRPS